MRIEHRAIELDTRDQDGTFPVTVSTETPVDRGRYWEVLDHRDGQVDLTRIPLPLIESHDTQRVNVGLIENAKLVSGQLKGHARLGASERARELVKDITAKIVRFLSVGYQLLDEGTPIGERDGKPVLRFRWMPYEASIVSVPADINAGFFRSQIMSTENNADRAVAAERERVMEINAIADRFRDRVDGMDKLRNAALKDNAAIDAFRTLVMNKLEDSSAIRTLDRIDQRDNQPGPLGLTSREMERYSLLRLLEGLADPKAQLRGSSFEFAVSEAAAKQYGKNVDSTRATIPVEVLGAGRMGRRDLTVGTNTAGGYLVPTQQMGLIELLRPVLVMARLGATIMSGLTGNVAFPRQTSAASAFWVAENGSPTESQLAIDQVTMTPKTVGTFTDISRRLRLQSSPAVEELVRTDLLSLAAQAIDQAAINGSGSSNQPTGLLLTSGIGSVVGGTNGLAPTWDHIVSLEASITSSNANFGSLGYLTTPAARAKLKRTQKFSGTNGDAVWSDQLGQDGEGVMNNYRAIASTLVPSNLTKGSGTSLSAITYGNWSDLMIGQWGGIDLLADPYTGGTAGTLRLIVLVDCDIAVRHPTSFAVMADAITT